ncbi:MULTISPECIES: hypothetical protein [unclassified Acinetobacter]|uniref:hypothetical protein n=1 Tax=unclassified Acinetobacter TaxID=196816 RepID=UPI0018AC2937|nr:MULTISPECIES: hypothetical protein [unclassified Acinetobacter]MBJ9954751.1 hypothetical protein [Acinetobacter baumannii]
MKKKMLFLICFIMISCTSENKSEPVTLSKEKIPLSDNISDEKEINPCYSDCTPRVLSTPYHRIVLTERKRIDKLVFKDFIDGLVYKKVITKNDYKNVNFNDNVNSLTILIRNSILIINPDSSSSGVKSIEYRFENCNQVSDFDKNNVRNILNLINFDKTDKDFYDFSKNGGEIMINNFYDKGVGLEVNCDPKNNSGQVNIYRR